jgi:hypothetical protein
MAIAATATVTANANAGVSTVNATPKGGKSGVRGRGGEGEEVCFASGVGLIQSYFFSV